MDSSTFKKLMSRLYRNVFDVKFVKIKFSYNLKTLPISYKIQHQSLLNISPFRNEFDLDNSNFARIRSFTESFEKI